MDYIERHKTCFYILSYGAVIGDDDDTEKGETDYNFLDVEE